MGSQQISGKMVRERKAIPARHCDYLIRMHLKSIEALSKYMAGGCQETGINDSLFVCVELITLKRLIETTLAEYSK